jgi:putative oxidoreductase
VKLYDQYFVPLFDRLRTPLLLALRLLIGWQFFVTGKGKLASIEHVIEFFASLGVPMPAIAAYVVACLEMIGGVLLAAGAAARLIALPLAITMIVAYATADRAAVVNLFQDPDAFLMAAPFPFLVVTLVVLAFGPGAASIDHFVRRRLQHH